MCMSITSIVRVKASCCCCCSPITKRNSVFLDPRSSMAFCVFFKDFFASSWGVNGAFHLLDLSANIISKTG
jgi:hypothetical protein